MINQKKFQVQFQLPMHHISNFMKVKLRSNQTRGHTSSVSASKEKRMRRTNFRGSERVDPVSPENFNFHKREHPHLMPEKSSPTWLTLTSWPRGQRWRSTRGRWGRGGGQGRHFGQGVHQVVRRHLLRLHLLGSHDGGGEEHLLRQPHLIFPQARIYRGSEQ